MTSYSPDRRKRLLTYKDLGSVNEVFRLAHKEKQDSLLKRYAGEAAIGHVRYATCGADDLDNAQPFERTHLQLSKWFALAYNGQLSNHQHLRQQVLGNDDHHLTGDSDTEILLHLIAQLRSEQPQPNYAEVMRRLADALDGSYSLALLDAHGTLLLARDPLGVKPMCIAEDRGMFAAASESVALINLGFRPDSIQSLEPGSLATVSREQGVHIERFAEKRDRTAHCFFEWVYFANAASTLDQCSVYLSRTRLGEALAALEMDQPQFVIDEDTIVVPVPDTSKPAADAMAHAMRLPCREGLLRNRYTGRTFIEGPEQRIHKAASKYTPLREVLAGRRIVLVEDSIVRSTTMRALLGRLRDEGGAAEIHVRVACPPILAPCYYGIDMSTIGELFAPRFLSNGRLTPEGERRMAADLGADSVRYLPIESVAAAIGLGPERLCQACITGRYPTPAGQIQYDAALEKHVGGAPANGVDSSVFGPGPIPDPTGDSHAVRHDR